MDADAIAVASKCIRSRWSVVSWCALGLVALLGCGGSGATGSEDADGTMGLDTQSDADAGRPDGEESGAGDVVDDAWPVPPDVPATCGNGVVDPGEECDDGNRMNGDECDWACHSGPGESPGLGPHDPAVTGFDAGADILPVETTEPISDGSNATLVWGETNYATVVGSAMGGVVTDPTTFIRFGTDGRRIGTEWRYLDDVSPQGYMDLVWNGDGYGLAWCADDASLWFVELDREGKPIYPPLEPVTVTDLCDPTLVWDGERYGLFWTLADLDAWTTGEEWIPGTDIYYVALGHRGVLLTDVVLEYHNDAGHVCGPDASTSGASHLVAFMNDPTACRGTDEYGCTTVLAVSRDGTRLREPVIMAAGGRSAVDTASADGHFGVLLDSLDPFGVHLAIFSDTGELLGPPVPVRLPGFFILTGAGTGIALAWGRDGWAVAYLNGDRGMFEPVSGVIRLDRVGRLVDVVPAGMSECFGGGNPGRPLDLAFDGGGFGLLCFQPGAVAFGRFVLEP
jgi:cysteine-rich repeat protein